MSYTFDEWNKLSPEKRLAAGSDMSPWKTWHKVTISILAILIIIMLIFISSIEDEKPEPSAADVHKRNVESLFSGWDGHHIKLEKLIKQNLNDPDSYEHVKTLFWDEGDSVIVKTTIRATNGFGGKVMATYRAVSDLEGNVRNITQED